MKPESYTSKNAGSLVPIAGHDGDGFAFVPAPLPPDLLLNPELVNTLSDACMALGELSGLGRTVSNPHLLTGSFMRREATLSSRIEGTQTEISDLYRYEMEARAEAGGGELSPHNPDAQEVANYVRAMEYGLERLETLPISLRFIRELHAKLMAGVRGRDKAPGEFRKIQNWIGGASPKSALYVPPPVPQMTEAIDDFERYLHAKVLTPPLVRLALIHYQFEAIHPFNDGNGRIGRLLVTLLLSHWQLLSQPLLYLSAYFESNRDEYYSRLRLVSERGEWEEWVLFFLKGVASQSRDAIARTKKLQDTQRQWKELMALSSSSAVMIRIIDGLFTLPAFTIPHIRDMHDISYVAARNNVNKLVKNKIVKQVGDFGRGKLFIASEIFDIISGEGVPK